MEQKQEDNMTINNGDQSLMDIEQIKLERDDVCACYPEHCHDHHNHGPCWCDPEVEVYGDNVLVVHNE